MNKKEKQALAAAKILRQERLDAVSRINEIDEQVHLLTKEKNLLGVSIEKIDAKLP